MNRPIITLEKVAIAFIICAMFAMLSITIVFIHDAYTNYSNSEAITIYKEQECLK